MIPASHERLLDVQIHWKEHILLNFLISGSNRHLMVQKWQKSKKLCNERNFKGKLIGRRTTLSSFILVFNAIIQFPVIELVIWQIIKKNYFSAKVQRRDCGWGRRDPRWRNTLTSTFSRTWWPDFFDGSRWLASFRRSWTRSTRESRSKARPAIAENTCYMKETFKFCFPVKSHRILLGKA